MQHSPHPPTLHKDQGFSNNHPFHKPELSTSSYMLFSLTGVEIKGWERIDWIGGNNNNKKRKTLKKHRSPKNVEFYSWFVFFFFLFVDFFTLFCICTWWPERTDVSQACGLFSRRGRRRCPRWTRFRRRLLMSPGLVHCHSGCWRGICGEQEEGLTVLVGL